LGFFMHKIEKGRFIRHKLWCPILLLRVHCISVLIQSLFQTRPSIEWGNLLSLTIYFIYHKQTKTPSASETPDIDFHFINIDKSHPQLPSLFWCTEAYWLLILSWYSLLLRTHRYPHPLRVNIASWRFYPADKWQQ
jgi:hypothetical protein